MRVKVKKSAIFPRGPRPPDPPARTPLWTYDVVVVVQDELQNHCRSRETCSFGTPDAVVCKVARSASAMLAAVGPSVGIAGGLDFGETEYP